MNIANLEVLQGLVAQKNTKTPQVIQVSASTHDINSGVVSLKWQHVHADGAVSDAPFASATIHYGDASAWLTSWIPAAHLVQGRIDALEQLANAGVANRFSHNMAYLLFGANLVDYAPKYRGMQSVVLHGLEAFADVTLTTEKGGTWTVPPYFIDSVAHLAGFVMNVSDAVDTKANYCVTPGWASMRFARPLEPGARYRSYVKMIPTAEDPAVFLGDVYVLQDGVVVGMVGGIKFRRYPRILLNRFFSAPDEAAAAAAAAAPAQSHAAAAAAPPPPALAPATKPAVPVVVVAAKTAHEFLPTIAPAANPGPVPAKAAATIPTATTTATVAAVTVETAAAAAAAAASDSIASKATVLIAREAGLEVAELTDDASFANLGVDSLMSLVIAEKFREELGVTVSGSLFLEYPTLGDLRSWLVEYYN